MEISVVIPAYNEQAVILGTIREVQSYLKKNFLSWEIIVVDDGSTDETANHVESISGVRLVKLRHNNGKGYAVKTGMLASEGEYRLFMDADNSTNISELKHMIKEIQRCDIVVGSRALIQSQVIVSQNFLKKRLGRIGNRCIRFLLQLPLRDTQCGFKLFRASTKVLFEQQTLKRWGFDFELLFLAHKRGFRVHESPVVWVNNSQSKVRSTDYIRVLGDLMRVRWNWVRGKYGIL